MIHREQYKRFGAEYYLVNIPIFSLLFTFESQIYEGQTLKVQSIAHSHWCLNIRIWGSVSFFLLLPFFKNHTSLKVIHFDIPHTNFLHFCHKPFSGSYSNYSRLEILIFHIDHSQSKWIGLSVLCPHPWFSSSALIFASHSHHSALSFTYNDKELHCHRNFCFK